VFAFLSHHRPRSVNAKTSEKYKRGIREIFKNKVPAISRSEDDLYAVVYYFHRVPTTQDADNISKPILDALEGLAYADDRLVKLRQAAIVDLRSPAMEALDLTRMPSEVFDTFIEKLDREDHTVYVELGKLDYRQLQFSYETLREV